jgi:hypothetical protein
MGAIWDAFVAFHVNAGSYLAYSISNNLWLLLIAAGAVTSIVLGMNEQLVVTVREEQQVI